MGRWAGVVCIVLSVGGLLPVLSQLITAYLRHGQAESWRLEARTAHILLECSARSADIKTSPRRRLFRKGSSKPVRKPKEYAWSASCLPVVHAF